MSAISPWNGEARATSPDGRYEAVFSDACEICMGGPVIGDITLLDARNKRPVVRLSGVNGSMVWSADSLAIAYPKWQENRLQHLAVYRLADRVEEIIPADFSVLELSRFRNGVVEGIDSPIHLPRGIRVTVGEK